MKELCMAGAASRGFCYIGALAKLEKQGMLFDLEIIAGVSIGAFVGVCIAIGYSPLEMFNILLEKNINDFQDISVEHVLNQGSILKGDRYKSWVWEVLAKKIDPMMTFSDIQKQFKKKLIMTTTCIQDGLVILSSDKTPNMPIFYAILSTMALPFIFPPVWYESKTYVDGGVLDNFPIRFLSKDALGLTVSNRPFEMDPSSVFSYIAKLFELISQQTRKLHGEWGYIVEIPASDFGLIDFNLSMDDKVTLYYRGYEAIDRYIDSVIEQETSNIMKTLVDNIVSSCD